jgi:small neutral amino acid transporter SnatA (MarC family)
MCIAIGMSEQRLWLKWAQLLIPLAAPLWIGSMTMPVVVLFLAKNEGRTSGRIASVVMLSAILSVASCVAFLPLVM